MLISKEVLNKNSVSNWLLSKEKLINNSIFGPTYNTYLYLLGDECTLLTGGYVVGYSAGTGTQSKQATYLYLDQTAGTLGEKTYVTNNLINFTGVKTIYVEWENIGDNDDSVNSVLAVSTNKTGGTAVFDGKFTNQYNFARRIDSLDVSNLNGDYYIRVHARTGASARTSKLKVYKIWGEY
jgi:hypothetical protein